MHSGDFVLVLHTHLPWVLHHGNWPHGVDWLSEAVAECYIPLLNSFNELLDEGIKARITMDISPVLCEQAEHPDFKDIFIKYCDEKIAWAEKDQKQFTEMGYDAHHIYLAHWWAEWYAARKKDFIEKYNMSIIGAMRDLQDKGVIEVATCGATHGYFPLLGTEESIDLQIHAAKENYKKHFGRDPRGIWLPECAYRPTYNWKSYIPVAPYHHPRLRPGVEQLLAKYDIEYFITDQDLTERAIPVGTYLDDKKENFVSKNSNEFDASGIDYDNLIYQPFHVASDDNVEYGTAAAFTRHRDIAMQVWSGEVGYPGQPDYLDFHKKHFGSMLRYWRVTDNKADMMYKTLYHPDWTQDKIDHQSNHFIHHIENTLNWFKNSTGKQGTLCTPFDTELFGHWWFEGPAFLKAVIKGIHNSPYVNTATCSEELTRVKPKEVVRIPEGSWGENNNHDVWINEDTKWTWESIYNDENALREIYKNYDINNLDDQARRILTQTLREMMLEHSSDWQFLIHTKSARDYAEQRFSYHHNDFNKFIDLFKRYMESKEISPTDLNYLEEAERRNSVFPELQIEWWNH
jgi:1,4-alpha-glucan branching enzyme